MQTNLTRTQGSSFFQPWLIRATCAAVIFSIVTTVLKTQKISDEQTSYLWGSVCAIGTYMLSKNLMLPFSSIVEQKAKPRTAETRKQEIIEETNPSVKETIPTSESAAMSDEQIIKELNLSSMNFSGKAQRAICDNFRSKSPILDLSNCDIRQIPEGLQKFTWLQHINLQDNYCLGNLAHLENLPRLLTVNVWGTAIARNKSAPPLPNVKIIATELEAIHQMLQNLTSLPSLRKIDLSSLPKEDHHKLLSWLKKITNRDTGWMGMYRFAPWESDSSKVATQVLTLLKNALQDKSFYSKNFMPFIEKSIASHSLGNDCVYACNDIMDQWRLHKIDTLSKEEMQSVLDYMFRKHIAEQLGREADPEKSHEIFASPLKYQHTFCRELGIELTFEETSGLQSSVSSAEQAQFQKLIHDKSLRNEFYISFVQKHKCLGKSTQENLDQIDQAKIAKLQEMAELQREISPKDYSKAVQDVEASFEKLKRETLLEAISEFTNSI